MHQTRIENWTAERSGAWITIVGIDKDTGAPIKVVGVSMISRGASHAVIASGRDGKTYELV